MIKGIIRLVIMSLILCIGRESYAQNRYENIEKVKVGNIEVKAFLKESTECNSQYTRYYIKFEIKNKSSESIKINRTLLPWENGSNTFTEVTLDNGETLTEIGLLPCLGTCEELIEPDETIVGHRQLNFVDKNSNIINFDEITKVANIVLVWSYIPDISVRTNKFSGEFFIPKQK